MIKKSVATLLMANDLYEQVETAMYENVPAQADEIMSALCSWPTAKTDRVSLYAYVTYSPRLLAMSTHRMTGVQYDQTLLHEVAHIISWIVFDCSGHGWHFRRVANMIQCDPDIQDDLMFEKNVLKSIAAKRAKRRTKLVAACPKCGREWHRVRRLNRGREYVCPDCKVTVTAY
jgi:predicted SprT family Zn-dependent metalloprotease